MTHHPTPDLGRSAGPYVAVTFVALALAGAMPSAQSAPPAESRPDVVQLHRGQPFRGDLRQLPDSLPGQRERRPDHEEPLLRTTGGHDDRAAQTTASPLPAPSPGTGSGAGSV